MLRKHQPFNFQMRITRLIKMTIYRINYKLVIKFIITIHQNYIDIFKSLAE